MNSSLTQVNGLVSKKALTTPLVVLAILALSWQLYVEYTGILTRMEFSEKLNARKVDRKRWIVVTTIQYPTEDIKRLVSLPGWSLVVVGDYKTPKNWSLEGAHYLSLETQRKLGFRVYDLLPYNSYTRKNIGYLYAMMNGAEWIYDTDDDNKPYGKGLEQFDYTERISGLRYGCRSRKNMSTEHRKGFLEKLFNPYEFFGRTNMWPRGFPIEYVKDHRNGLNRSCLCHTMKTAAVQQGLVHKDPDVDAVYRLLNADSDNGLNESFNEFAPPVTLASGVYAPWNSQNTLFHRNSFFTLLLPISVSFRVTDIWRSYIAQKLLHIVGENIAFYPANAIQFRNKHDYLADFESERAVYENSGKLVDFLDGWECELKNVAECAVTLAKELSNNGFWGKEDAQLVENWIQDLKSIGYDFPRISTKAEYRTFRNLSRGENCRPANIQLFSEKSDSTNVEMRSYEKIKGFGELADFCSGANSSDVLSGLPSPKQISDAHANRTVLSRLRNTVLLITCNYALNGTIGILQRMYQPYFGLTIFCGTWLPEELNNNGDLLEMVRPYSYIYLSENEMVRGYYAYYCLSKVKDLRLGNIDGYFVNADDNVFNFWHELDLNKTIHSVGIYDKKNVTGPWWRRSVGMNAAKKAVQLFEERYDTDEQVRQTWNEYQAMLENSSGHGVAASQELTKIDGWSVSDFYYIPSHLLDYHARLMELFFEAELFHEIAISKYLHTVPHIAFNSSEALVLWGNARSNWYKLYNEGLFSIHPIKFNSLRNDIFRHRFCDTVLTAFWSNLMDVKKERNITED